MDTTIRDFCEGASKDVQKDKLGTCIVLKSVVEEGFEHFQVAIVSFVDDAAAKYVIECLRHDDDGTFWLTKNELV